MGCRSGPQGLIAPGRGPYAALREAPHAAFAAEYALRDGRAERNPVTATMYWHCRFKQVGAPPEGLGFAATVRHALESWRLNAPFARSYKLVRDEPDEVVARLFDGQNLPAADHDRHYARYGLACDRVEWALDPALPAE